MGQLYTVYARLLDYPVSNIPGSKFWTLGYLEGAHSRYVASCRDCFPSHSTRRLELGWFNEYPGFYNSTPGMMPMQYMPTAGGFVPYGQTQGQQQPLPQGHTLIVQPHHGQPPTITSVPYGSAGGV